MRHEDDVVVNRALPAIATGVDPSEEGERHLKQALLASVFGNSNKPPDIPVPVASSVDLPPCKEDFQLPEEYIIFDRSDAELIDDTIEYDGDYIDDEFAKKASVRIEDVELAMDCLEKSQGHDETLISWSAAHPRLTESFPTFNENQRRIYYDHWHCRREAHKHSFLRFFQAPPDPSDPDQSVAFRPRDREAGAAIAHRMNTYDNYRRAKILRDEVIMLRQLVADVVQREQVKSQALSLRLLAQRFNVTVNAGPQIDNVIRYVFASDVEPVLVFNSQRAPTNPLAPHPQTFVPCRGLNLPHDFHIEKRRLATDKIPKKTRKKVKQAEKRPQKDMLTVSEGPDRLITTGPPNYDLFGFDEHGNRFLKLMRCFSGGFNNYGVSPYDHRVFAAASERNTVRDLPREPRAINFPSREIKFGTRSRRMSRGGKVGPRFVSPDEMKRDILGERHVLQPNDCNDVSRKMKRVIRVRGRVGRGGRILFDRVPFERERGVKAASYPASVDMGGVYTAGLPLDAATRVSEETSHGGLGKIAQLTPPSILDTQDGPFSETSPLIRKLVPSLKPMMETTRGVGLDLDVLNYWPRRKYGGRSGCEDDASGTTNIHSRGEESVAELSPQSSISSIEEVRGDDIRRLPSYLPRDECFIDDV